GPGGRLGGHQHLHRSGGGDLGRVRAYRAGDQGRPNTLARPEVPRLGQGPGAQLNRVPMTAWVLRTSAGGRGWGEGQAVVADRVWGWAPPLRSRPPRRPVSLRA